jgi:hypothetical protein
MTERIVSLAERREIVAYRNRQTDRTNLVKITAALQKAISEWCE